LSEFIDPGHASNEYDEKLAGSDMPEEALKEAQRVLKRFKNMDIAIFRAFNYRD